MYVILNFRNFILILNYVVTYESPVYQAKITKHISLSYFIFQQFNNTSAICYVLVLFKHKITLDMIIDKICWEVCNFPPARTETSGKCCFLILSLLINFLVFVFSIQ